MSSRNAVVPTRMILLLASQLALVGCASSDHFPGEFESARKVIDAAEREGAGEHSAVALASARESMEDGQEAEEAATADQTVAADQLRAARVRGAMASQRLERCNVALAREREQLALAEADVARIDSRAVELHERGASDGEIDTIAAPQVALAQQRLDSASATIVALERQVRLYELESEDAELDQRAAKARLLTAQHRLQVAQLLYQRAEEQARLAETESLDVQRVDVSTRLTHIRP